MTPPENGQDIANNLFFGAGLTVGCLGVCFTVGGGRTIIFGVCLTVEGLRNLIFGVWRDNPFAFAVSIPRREGRREKEKERITCLFFEGEGTLDPPRPF